MKFLLTVTSMLLFYSCTESSESAISKNVEDLAEYQETVRMRIPGGLFIYGASEEQFTIYVNSFRFNYPGMKEKLKENVVFPSRTEQTSEFEIDEFEVTNQQFLRFVQATNYSPEDSEGFLTHWNNGTKPPEWASDFPVVWISQRDAQAYCEWNGGRLPTDLEWEKAARGSDGRIFPWGNSELESSTTNIGGELEPVGNRPEDQSPFYVYDMGGNVSELTATVSDTNRVIIKGGCFRSGYKDALTYTRNYFDSSDFRDDQTGFRCVAN